MKVKFEKCKDREMFRFIPIEFSVSKRGLPHRHAVYLGCELGYRAYVLQFKWHTRGTTND